MLMEVKWHSCTPLSATGMAVASAALMLPFLEMSREHLTCGSDTYFFIVLPYCPLLVS